MKTRLTREDPDRSGPIRSWDTLFRPSDASAEPAEAPPQTDERESAPSWNETANRAVERGYQVIEEQIRQGQRIAEKFRSRAYDAQDAGDEVSQLVERSLRFYTDVGAMWFELVESLLRNPVMSPTEIYRRQAAAGADARTEKGSRASHSTERDLDIEVSSRKPVRVTVDMSAPVDDALVVQALRALDAAKPPITGVRFERAPGRPVLRIDVAPEQPADAYTGAIIDTRTNLPTGVLCVSVREPEASSAIP
jgi:hypothetical protein